MLLSKHIYTLNKQYLNSQTISGIKYCCLRESQEKRQIQTLPLQKWYSFQLTETTASDQISDVHSHRNTYTILSRIREAEGPENVRKWSV